MTLPTERLTPKQRVLLNCPGAQCVQRKTQIGLGFFIEVDGYSYGFGGTEDDAWANAIEQLNDGRREAHLRRLFNARRSGT